MSSLSSVSLTPIQDPFVDSTSIADILLRAAHDFPHSAVRIFVAERSREILLTYSALLEEAQHILGALRARGLEPGARIVVVLEHLGDFIPAFWGCVLGGYVPCLVKPVRNDPAQWAAHLKHLETLLECPFFITTNAIRPELPSGVTVEDIDSLRAGPPEESVSGTQLEDAAVMMLTSGSTGNAKAVVLSHGNLFASLRGKTERQQLGPEDVTLNWVVFDHVACLCEAHLLPLYVGANQLHAEPGTVPAEPLLFLRLISRYRVTMTFAPNFLFRHINNALLSTTTPLALDLSCLRHIISGGEAIVVETGRHFLELLARYGLTRNALWPAFGMTETCAGSVYSREFPHGDQSHEFASLGYPITDLQMRILDEQGTPVSAGQIGELQLRGPMIFTHYYNNEEATRNAFTGDGWFRTGDQGFIEGGCLHLSGRIKDSIIVNGNNYSCAELENALVRLDGIDKTFLAVTATRPKGADTEQVAVFFAPPAQIDDDAKLRKAIIDVRNTTIRQWGFRPAVILPLTPEDFPKTGLGKILRTRMRKRLEDGEFTAQVAQAAVLITRGQGEYCEPQGAAEVALAGIFARIFALDAASVGATANFFDFDGGSLEVIRLKMEIERHFELVNFPIPSILANPTVRTLAAAITTPPEGDYDPVTPLQLKGNKTPIFIVHAASGEVLVFMGLAGCFADERPVYALRARGLHQGEPLFTTFSEMVDAYVAGIRRRQAHGPYVLVGYSYGAAVVFEVAKKLEEMGERVAFMCSVDGTPHIGRADARFDQIDSTVTLAFFVGLLNQQQLQELPRRLRAAAAGDDPCALILKLAPPSRVKELGLDLTTFRAWARLSHQLVQLGEKHEPSGLVESLTVLYAQPFEGTKEDWLNNQLRRWDPFVQQEVRYREIAGEHHTMFAQPHLTTLYTVLHAEIERALNGA